MNTLKKLLLKYNVTLLIFTTQETRAFKELQELSAIGDGRMIDKPDR